MKKSKISDDTFLVSSSDDFFDDCPICQAMKKAQKDGRNLSESEIKEAFEESKKAGGVVGTTPTADKPPKKSN